MNGDPKNKELTKRKLIAAVGEILKSDGYKSLGVNRVAKQAGVNKKLIYRYFGNLNYLIESYVVENDYWMAFSNKLNDILSQTEFSDTKELITGLLQKQFSYFLTEREMQRLILWEISANSDLMRSIHNARESQGQKILQLTDASFEGTNVNFRAIAALLVGGIYYTILHTNSNGGMFCDIDIKSETGQKGILKAIEQIVGWAYQESKI
jgi:AcrR family transcriptional regulator